jgi:NADH-quinone oxidoreductase subunit B
MPDILGEPTRFVVNRGRRYALSVFNFGLACCAVEFVAAAFGRHEAFRLVTGPEDVDAHLMVISGTVTDRLAPAIMRTYAELPSPKYVLSFGACANSGGPYWDSYVVTKGVDQLIPVDVYVPGCPPRPEALLDGLDQLEVPEGGHQR